MKHYDEKGALKKSSKKKLDKVVLEFWRLGREILHEQGSDSTYFSLMRGGIIFLAKCSNVEKVYNEIKKDDKK